MRYFAYGSNMSHARLAQRTPSAKRIGVAELAGHRLRFHKVGHLDGTGKCDAEHTGVATDRVIGVVYEIDDSEKTLLDGFEGVGLGYEVEQVSVTFVDGDVCVAFVYIATHIDPAVEPFHWYKLHVMTGARENQLPADYIEMIEQVRSIDDPDPQRHNRETALYTEGTG
ncbi:MAG: gamma-glutamylcyclotransferase [Candidatus Thiodiazotropha sp.]